jgi:hypothetical protein
VLEDAICNLQVAGYGLEARNATNELPYDPEPVPAMVGFAVFPLHLP